MSERDAVSSVVGSGEKLLTTSEHDTLSVHTESEPVTSRSDRTLDQHTAAVQSDTLTHSDEADRQTSSHISCDDASEDLFAQTKCDAANDITVELLMPSSMPVKLFKRRWFMIFLFASYSMANAYQWIHLNIIFDKVVLYYNESLPGTTYMKEVAVDWLSMIYMLAYIPLIVPVTWLLDQSGLRVVAIIATFLNALGAWLKCAAVRPDLFALLMTAQTICAVAQVFILGIPARLAAVWFGPNEVSTATAIGVFGNQVCIMSLSLITVSVVSHTHAPEKVQLYLWYTPCYIQGCYGYCSIMACSFSGAAICRKWKIV